MMTTQQLKELSRPRLSRFLFHLAIDWAGISAIMAVFHFHPTVATFLLGSVALGLFQHALPILGHEAVHFRVCESRWLNEFIGNFFCFFPVVLTVSAYREFHFPHHRNPFGKDDPEVPLRHAIRGFDAPFTLTRGLRIWVLSYFGFSLRDLGAFVSMIPKGEPGPRRLMGMVWLGVIAAVYATGTWVYLALWFASLATTYFTSIQIQGWYEHGLQDLPACRYTLPSMFFRLIVPHGIWLHYEHHKYPAVPFYNLPKVRALDTSDPVYTLNDLIDALHTTKDSNPVVIKTAA